MPRKLLRHQGVLMTKDIVREKLERLHTQLKNTRSSDSQTQERIRILTADIRDTLDHLGENRPEQNRGVLERMQGAVRQFETSHPELTSVLNDVISSLANWGF
jgi:tRNA C32,U32 (ribose-2'-O)-methylase TrmJ